MSHFKRAGNVDSLAGFRTPKPEAAVPYGLLKAARKSGQLNLSGRGLTEVPQNVYRLNIDDPAEAQENVSFRGSDRWWEQTDLTKLLLSSNQLTQLSEDIKLLPALTILDDLSNNLLKHLPCSVGRLSALRKISLCHNKLSSLPDGLGQLANVKLLDCSHNQLTNVPVSLAGMLALEQLYLQHNKLRRLPQLPAPALREVFAGNNQVELLEAEQLSCLSAVTLLELRDNKIRNLPEELALLLTLTRLDLSNNDISTLPASLSLLPNLKVLLLEGNPLRGIRRELLAKGTSDLLKYLRGRIKEEAEGAAGPTAMTLPSEGLVNTHNIKTLKMLEYIDKQAASVPDEVFDAAAHQAITSVNFSRNQLTAFPPRLLELHSSLSDINLGFNRLSCCSADICSLQKLTHIDLRNNQLTDLPSEMKNLSKLRCIVLNHNRFSSFPEALYQIVTLETVMLGNNQVGGVDPSRLMQLLSLSTLDLSNNDLLNVPPELGLCTSLRCLSLEGNPFRTPRAAIVAKGTNAVLEYLRSRIPT
ncbi:leucine-rich repeat-containing protein 40 isoform X2 [Poecilia latipinna]|uniref:leucine-rich repeat-containing protein 40 isoform X2 n=1 Tax=Poecilia latipinna TaxID=48699 RepID=UPI00072DCF3B|nr:PREDICTED: leucine-rich repeat-containing protein 40 isoform X2 [Poecilia latipinna]